MPSADPQHQSPSPQPAPPIALTPGPRAAAFTTLYNSALSNTLKSVPYESFAACFPSIAEQAPAALKAMHSGLTSRLEQFAKDEFQTIMEERAVVERLNSLEDVIAEAKRRKARAADGEDIPVPPHTLPAPLLLSSHLTPLHISQQSQLNAKLQTAQSQNASLAQEIGEQRKEIEALLKQAEMLVKDLEGSGELMAESIGRDGLSDRAREAEEVVMGGT